MSEAYSRLSDKVLEALELALEQDDGQLAGILSQALEMTLTRSAGGAGFQERREYSERMGIAFNKVEKLRSQA